MSRKLMDTIWQPDKVLPYILGELKQNIEKITPVHSIYLYGSRARTPVGDWGKLDGKDWDIAVVCNFPIVNVRIWTTEKNYHIDLKVITPKTMEYILSNYKYAVQLYPKYELDFQIPVESDGSQ